MKPHFSAFNFSINNQNSDTVDVFIDGIIVDAETQQIYQDFFGDTTSVSYKSLREQVGNTNAGTINFYINSGGGLVTDAMAIHDWIKDMQKQGKKVNTIGRGLIASAATYILMAGNNSSISENSWFMIHNVSGFAYGDVNQVENEATTLRKFNDTVTKFYAQATGLSQTVIGNMMNKETWLTGVEAKEKGFVKNTIPPTNFTNSIKPEQWQFQNTAVLNAYNSFTQNNNEMKFSEITNAVENAVKKALENIGLGTKPTNEVKPDEIATAVANAVAETLKPLETSITDTVTNAVTAALKTIPKNFQEAIDTSIENLATTEAVETLTTELEEVKTGIANKLGGGAKPKGGENKGTGKWDKDGVGW